MAIHIDLAGETAWVTGGASGIGRAIATALAEAGARVVSLDRAHVSHHPGTGDARIRCAQMDVGDAASVDATAAALVASALEPGILVNCAGITRDAPVWKLGIDDWRSVLDVNLSGAFYLTRAVVPLMRERRAGAIVNIASVNGLRGKFGQANYSASKGGLIALTRTLARELGPRGIRVNAVAPGMSATPMTDALPADVRAKAERESALGTLGRPEDVAAAALFLASPLAAHVTGHVLVVDGGQTA